MNRPALLGLLLLAIGPVASWAFDIPPSDIVILGEVHDNPTTHEWQAQAVTDLQPKAIVWEMLTPAQAEAIRGVDLRDADAIETAIDWSGSGWPAFSLYHPIFLAAPDALHLGAALTRDQVRQASQDGAAAVMGQRANTLRTALARSIADQQARETEQAGAHCGLLPPEMLPGMVEVQAARDAAMALAAIDAARQNDVPVVIITGNGHARRDRGIPAYIAAAAPDLRVFSVGFVEGEAEPGLYDLTRNAPPVERGDPCDSLRNPD